MKPAQTARAAMPRSSIRLLALLRTVFIKELIDSLRDRRTLLTVMITAIIMGPLSLLLIGNFISGIEQKNAARRIQVYGLQYAPELANFLARNAITPLAAPPDYEDQIRSGKLQEAVIVIPKDFSERFGRGDSVPVSLTFDDSRNEAQPSIHMAEALLKGFSREVVSLRLIQRGLSPQLLRAVEIEHINTATPKQQAAFLLFLIPMFALLGAVVGSMSVAIDTTAGERERGSLEPLLMNPVDLRALVLGKWAVVTCFASGVVMLTLAGFVVTTHLVPSEKLSALFQFGIPEFIRFCAMAVPFAGMIGALQMLVATYGRSFKEAQTYASYITLIINFVPLITVFAAVKDALWQLFVPALAQQMVLARILRGDPVGPRDYLIPLAIAVLLTTLCLWGLTRLLRQERIIFGR